MAAMITGKKAYASWKSDKLVGSSPGMK